MSKKIDYSKLSTGDILGTTNFFNPISAFIRAGEVWSAKGKCNIFKAIAAFFNPNIASHTFVVCKDHDLFYGIELTWPKIHICDLNEYEGGNLGSHIVFAAKPPNITEMSENISKYLIKLHYLGVIKYNWKGLFEFPIDRLESILKIKDGDIYEAKVDPNKQYCSQFVFNYLKTLENWISTKFGMPLDWYAEEEVSPLALQNWFKKVGWNFNWWK